MPSQTGTKRTNGGSSDGRNTFTGVVANAQEAAGRVITGAERAAEHLPEVVEGAQVYARETQQALNRMPDQTLLVGTGFSLGVAVGFFFAGANRLLSLLALLPAAAMAATLIGREEEAEGGRSGQRRARGG
ncbi:MAG TPA: hypothetical protein VNW68_04490 [Candidatus Limnocylindria bacterium]|jgi:hypothetical protein|nr:hypothetical protein [Candidatus Limnocylindria bacterium]